MQEEAHDEEGTNSESSPWPVDTKRASSERQDSSADSMLVGIQEKPGGELYTELEELEEKVNALIARCEKLRQMNDSLTKQLTKESESRLALLELQTDARKRVDQLIRRLRDLEEESK